MRGLASSTAILLALLATACGGGSDAASGVSTDVNLADDAALNAVLGANALSENEAAVVNPTDAAGFTTAVASSDLFEIESGRLAQQKATAADLKAFGAQLVTDHTRSTAQLKAAAAKAEPAATINPALDPQHQSMLDELKAATGADFDRLFIDHQTRAHQNALNVLQSYANGGDQEPLKEFASNASKVVQGHLSHVNGIKK